MSPERVRGENLDARSDLFSTGVVLYELITGRRAFSAPDIPAIMDLIVSQSPVPLRELNPPFTRNSSELSTALEKNRKLRFQTAADLRADLQRLKRDLDSVEAVTTRRHSDSIHSQRLLPAASPRGRRIAVAGAVMMGSALMAIVIAVFNRTSIAATGNAPAVPSSSAARGDVVLPAPAPVPVPSS